MQQVLFVDDDPDVLAGLRRQLFPLRKEFVCLFASSGQEALECLATQPVGVVVSDMRMPEMDGGELLAEVRTRHPHAIRIVFSGQSDPRKIAAAVQSTHQYLAKPCDPAVLRATLRRCVGLQEQALEGSLQQVIAALPSLPSLPALYLDLLAAIEDPRCSVAQVAAILGRDMGMTAKVLQLVNSAYFGRRRRISSPEIAVSVLGLDTLRPLVLSLQVFRQIDGPLLRRFGLDALAEHGLQVGFLAQRLATCAGCHGELGGDALTAGLLHDVGKLILATGLPDDYASALAVAAAENLPARDGEQQVLGGTHADVGGHLLGLWGLPEEVVQAVAWHHEPWRAPSRQLTAQTFVHVANALVNQRAAAEQLWPEPELDMHYLGELGLDELPREWLAAADATLGPGGQA